MGECDGVGALHREVAVSLGVYSAMIPAHDAVGARGVERYTKSAMRSSGYSTD